MGKSINVPVFALDEAFGWDDLEDAITGPVEYQSTHRGIVLPVMFFCPMTTPENLDAWEPMKEFPEDLFIVSIERTMDDRILRALRAAEPVIGVTALAAEFPAVKVNEDLPISDVYHQMLKANVVSFAMPLPHKDDPSFFLLQGWDAVNAFNEEFSRLEK